MKWSEISMIYGTEIIKLLEDEGITLDEKLKNTVELLAYEVYNKGKENGYEEGRISGINKACKEMENKIAVIRSKE
jgi:hypothetical protein